MPISDDASVDFETAELAVELANAYLMDGYELYDWQEDVVLTWLGRDENTDIYLFGTCILLVPRQNGKTKGIIAARILAGAVFFGESIRYSSHRVDSMMDMWRIFVRLFGNPDDKRHPGLYPELHALVHNISFRNGDLYIELKNGSVIYFVARSKGSGRGKSVDVNIYDEAQYMTEENAAADLPAQSAAPSGNPQTIYVGTPPDYVECSGEVFGNIRESAIKGEPDICLHEWSVDSVGDVSDETRWYDTNPALGYSLLVRAVKKELATLSAEKFAIERLGWWPSVKTNHAIQESQWNDTLISDPSAVKAGAEDTIWVGVKFSPDSIQVCVSIAVMQPDGTIHAELVHNGTQTDGMQWLVDWLVDRRGKIAYCAIDGKSGGTELYERLGRARFPKKAYGLMTTSQVTSAATTVNNGLAEKSLTHFKDKVLDSSALTATKRKISDGYGFGGDSCPIESFAAAVYAAKTVKRDPKKKMRVL